MTKNKVWLAMGSVLLGFVLLEVGLKLLNYPYVGCESVDSVSECRSGQFDSELGWSYKEHNSTIEEGVEYIINDEGYRTDSVDNKTDFSKPIILIVGNSVIFGHGINFKDTFGYKLQNKLENEFQVINMAVQGYGLDQVYLKLKQVMKKYKPKYVIMDFIDDYDNRNVNRDRRSLYSCNKFSGTKPLFSIKNNELVLKYMPVRYEEYDFPRTRLVWRRLIDTINQRQKNKTELTKMLYLKIKQLVSDDNSILLDINYWSNIRDFQLKDNNLGVVEIYMDEMSDKVLDGFHPNSSGTTLILEKFWNINSNLFSDGTK